MLWLIACSPRPAEITHEAYVWQRLWTPAVIEAVQSSPQLFKGLRVLGLQVTGAQRHRPQIDLGALAATRRPVRLVIRIEGSRPTPDTAEIASWANAEAARWRAAGVNLVGVEIDHDCANAGLGDYARWLVRLRGVLDPALRLSITALPAWIASSDLPAVLSAVDDSVLQVHALDRRARDLIDAQQSLAWIRRYDEIAPSDFQVALPAYSLRVDLDAAGEVRSVDAEGEQQRGGAGAQERHAPPRVVASVLAELRVARLTHLRGAIWFRLPVADDRRAWSMATLSAVITDRPLASAFVLRSVGAAPAIDLALENRGNLDAAPPDVIRLPAQCATADALQHYSLDTDASGIVLRRRDTARLRSGESWRIAWARCDPPLTADWSLNVSPHD